MERYGPFARLARRAVLAACAAWLLLYVLRTLAAPGLDLGPLTSRFAHDVVLLAASGLILARALHTRRERLAWALIGAGVLAWTLGEIYYTAVLWDAETIAIPSPADAGYLLMPPLALAGLALLLRARARAVPRTLWVDGIVASLSVAAVSAAIVFETVLDRVEGDAWAVATNLAYPLGDLVLLAVIVGALAGTGLRMDRTWILLAIGVSTFWLADSLYLVKTAEGTFTSGGLIDTGWWTGLLLVAAAAWQRAPGSVRPPEAASLRPLAVPLGFGAIGLALLVYGCFAHVNGLAVALAACCGLAVMVRLVLTFRENVGMLQSSREEALTDSLTGLGNRRALTQALEDVLPGHGRPAGEAVLALFDLDGFKRYNDSFGHLAGDALLERLGRNLAACVEGRGRAFRMGGDEFCILFEPGADGSAVVVESAAAALSERGEAFAIGCSSGSARLPEEAGDAATALQLADQRMYAAKQRGRPAPGRPGEDVLLRALAEADPGLEGQLGAVAALAERVARRLALPTEDVDRIRTAGELHDTGKMAIPEDILGTPGPLSDGELAYVRSHSLIGERIVSSAPALMAVALLVRSTHERWDGAGYPDRLRADAIPLGARIVAVCDAYDAMTTERPHARARTPQEALDELRACAGTQFDPAVVETFRAVLGEQPLGALARC